MTLSATSVGDNVETPGLTASSLYSDQLIAGRFIPETTNVTIGAGTLKRGTVLGVVTATGDYVLSVATAADGSQVPVAILADDADASAGAVVAPAYLTGEFNSNRMTYDASWTLAALQAALLKSSIFVKVMAAALSASDPT